MSELDVKNFLFAAGILCSVFSFINLFRANRRFLGLAFLALGITCIAYASTMNQVVSYAGGAVVIVLLIIDIVNRSGPPKK